MPEANFQSRVRVAGIFTVFCFAGQPITFCQQVSLTTAEPVGGGAAAIQPMDEPYPIEIITPAAAGMGQIVLNMFELFGQGGVASKVWDRLGLQIGESKSPFGSNTENASTGFPLTGKGRGGIFAGAVDIVDIFIRQAKAEPSQTEIVKIIRPLSVGKEASEPYSEEYHGCVITKVVDGEQVAVGTMEILKQITVNWTHMTRNGQPSAAIALRNSPL